MLNQVVIKEIIETDYNFIVIVVFVVLKKLDMKKKTDKLELEVKLKVKLVKESQKTN